MVRFIIFLFFLITKPALASQNVLCSVADIVEELSPAVVNISTTQLKKLPFLEEMSEESFEDYNKSPFQDKPTRIISLGSGFFIDNKGHIVTNYHAVDGAQEINVTFGDNDQKIYKAQVIGKDKKTDLALLKINTKNTLPFVKFGDSDKVRVGESVIAIGNSFGFGGTVTSGIVSAKGRYLANFHEELIQTDASINKGNSGGPMFNMNGEVIGVNSAIFSPNLGGGNVGIGFAIPSNTVKSVIDLLMKYGKIDRPWLGITFQHITEEIAKSFNLVDTRGIIVSNVVKGGPAEKAGVKIGDVVTKFNGITLNKTNLLPKIIESIPLSQKVPMEVIRNGKDIVIHVMLELPKNENPFHREENNPIVATAYHGISVANLTDAVRNYYGISETVRGLIVLKVDQDSDAYVKGLRYKDIIVSVNNTEVTSVKQFRTSLTNIKLNSQKTRPIATFLIYRKKANFYISINLN